MPWLVVVFPVIRSMRVSVVTSMNLPRTSLRASSMRSEAGLVRAEVGAHPHFRVSRAAVLLVLPGPLNKGHDGRTEPEQRLTRRAANPPNPDGIASQLSRSSSRSSARLWRPGFH